MIEFFVYLVTISITPGPNTIMSMANAAEKGLKGVTLNIGMFLGITLVSILSYAFVSILSSLIPSLSLLFQILSFAYLVYLGVKMLRKKDIVEGRGGTMKEGFMMQIANVKVMMLSVTAISSYIQPSSCSYAQKIAMVLAIPSVCFLSGLAWALAGSAIKSFYSSHRKTMNILFSLSLFALAASVLYKTAFLYLQN